MEVRSSLSQMRSLLFVPGSEPRRFAKALESAADAVIFDLEDGVAPDRKAEARSAVVQALADRPPAPACLVRINSPGGDWGRADLRELASSPLDGLVIPKAASASLAVLTHAGPPLIALVETAVGLLEAAAIAEHPRVAAMMLGAADLAAELGMRPRPDGLELLHARSTLAVCSAAARIAAPLDVVHLDVTDTQALRDEAEMARSLGFGGKPCIHPGQVATVNEVFSSSPAELDEARDVIAAYQLAADAGEAVVVCNGRMVDQPVVARAQAIIERAEGL